MNYPQCKDCLYGVEVTKEQREFIDGLNYKVDLYCKRYPEHIYVFADGWCGEWVNRETGQQLDRMMLSVELTND